MLIHIVDLDGARAGRRANLEAIGRIAGRVAVPLQVAGGMEEPDNIRLASPRAPRACGFDGHGGPPETLRECLAVAGNWLAVGLDHARSELPRILGADPRRRA